MPFCHEMWQGSATLPPVILNVLSRFHQNHLVGGTLKIVKLFRHMRWGTITSSSCALMLFHWPQKRIFLWKRHTIFETSCLVMSTRIYCISKTDSNKIAGICHEWIIDQWIYQVRHQGFKQDQLFTSPKNPDICVCTCLSLGTCMLVYTPWLGHD